ncbi:hypothetical protein I5677_07020 [Mobilitalea sibirica]|uniref:Uncharacterized protein n=1 Tax=Mobilitalea sibirica TaxID=1462919 RepID=A0A8J7H6K5_9FIRM|nr:hypothetical protein [Mobilitalea sibirica]MBH1940636.1 hypothetical protein [Mobilitalea sibirica]
MKFNNISDIGKILIFAASIIVVCVLVAVGFKLAKEGKSSVNAGTSQINTMSAEYSSIDITVYDNCTILGSELVNLINKIVDKQEYLSIVVRTLDGSRTDYNYSFDFTTSELSGEGTKTITTNKALGSYINKSAEFQGSIKRDENNNIICIWFEQKP